MNEPATLPDARPDATLPEAAERAYRAGHELVIGHIDLVVLRTKESLAKGGVAVAYGTVAVIALGYAWLCLVAAFVVALGMRWSWPGALLVAGGLHLTCVLLVGWRAASRLRGARS